MIATIVTLETDEFDSTGNPIFLGIWFLAAWRSSLRAGDPVLSHMELLPGKINTSSLVTPSLVAVKEHFTQKEQAVFCSDPSSETQKVEWRCQDTRVT